MRRRQAGWTLVELLVVLTLVAAAAAGLWRLQPLRGRLALRVAATALVSDLRMVQARSLGERNPDRAHGLVLSVGSDRYLRVVRTAGVVEAAEMRILPFGVRITYARFGGAVPTTVWFTGGSWFGAPSGGGTVTLASGPLRLCVRLMPATGRARVAHTGCP
ncbi:MAG: prepilin-type N-terminal cleavage/methylation domain-containing protein [Armatimonadota bacterium]|nr:prepilin-type N-terminal cleavage/methylation domain-containing protein [Armatimonadota bacterium]MDR7450389.1 prepilin-type N-terminal cleavage/methylation domain-containing protein [Armatimonadota bacterium]MDR7467028.1 prepilin-type N-terminal cleavage/methylation domain-containing protein [Armatimonadota bacterium]MDR7493430.1 prepilin-type N-terminal cleavage/methylation domain-containing protein [Armatimonadota bacterium]MDR7498695.1 prepilin-type N-terminal cleavage/methylation domain